ncbi:helix-turn-helix domain-containing protein [Fodinicola acaciae]|uniref:helix-turn-helix domain-containing protein n=1 Tax=Fodinicola acaciae TaxID=2681555 RepID=UPI001C9E4507
MFTAVTATHQPQWFWRAAARSMREPEPGPELVLTVAEACRALRISRWSLYQLIRTQQLSTVTIGRRRLIPVAALHEFIAQSRTGDIS